MRKIFLILPFILLVMQIVVHADSPLNSTNICEAYKDVSIVSKALEMEEWNDSVFEYLKSEENPIDVKAAVINTLMVNNNLEGTAKTYAEKVLNTDLQSIKMEELTAHQLFCIGYLISMENLSESEKGLLYLNEAKKKDQKSLTIALITAVVESQTVYLNDDTRWGKFEKVLDDRNLSRDMRQEAIKIVFDYMVLYSQKPAINPYDINIQPNEIEIEVNKKTEAIITGGVMPYNVSKSSFTNIEINNDKLIVSGVKEGTDIVTITDSTGLKTEFKIQCKNSTKQEITISFIVDSNLFTANGIQQEIDPGKGTKPVILSGSTMIPIRKFVETVGGKVDWDGSAKKLTIVKDDRHIELFIGKDSAKVDGQAIPLEASPQIINGHTFVPLRFVSESLGAMLQWNTETQVIDIKILGNLNIDDSQMNCPANIVNGKIAYYYDGYIYYQNGLDNGNLYKMKLSDGTKIRIVGGIPIDFVIYKGWIYYSDINERLTLYKVLLEGGQRVNLGWNCSGRYLNLMGDYLIFESRDYGEICRLNLIDESLERIDDICRPSPMTNDGEWIYYSEDSNIYKLKPDGSEKRLIKKGNAYYCFYSNGYIYYKTNYDAGLVYRIDRQGGDNQLVINRPVRKLNVYQNKVYYVSPIDPYEIHTYDMNTGEDRVVENEFDGDLNICAGMLINSNATIK